MTAARVAGTYAARAARTRYLIQLGGLVVKAGLPELLNLAEGSDLQRDHRQEAMTLRGAMRAAKEIWVCEEGAEKQFAARGAAYLRDYYAFTGGFAERIAAGNLSTARAIRDLIRGYEAEGCDELVLLPTVADLDDVDRLAEVIA